LSEDRLPKAIEELVRRRAALGAACRAARAIHGLSQPAFAERTGLSEALVRKIEAGERHLAESETLRICNAAGLALADWERLVDLCAAAAAQAKRLALSAAR
jgi:transcriptional regulator with XRE-family HTH domain